MRPTKRFLKPAKEAWMRLILVMSNISATGNPLIFIECWGHFPNESTRYDCGVQYPLYDITSTRPNFGAIEINWDASPPRAKIELRDVDGNSVNEISFLLSLLQAKEVTGTREHASGYQQHCTLETDLSCLLRKKLALILWAVVGVIITTGEINKPAISVGNYFD
ncbi:hypothetical protein FCM35_KLT13055 [Carex littledalei]|uniref:Uncharacterized protein n=1 Tax=Carex littledalei TaxID=544730 RepID=A0A833V2A9_9POAL|nr:hypothetical protein FCM35_KLT13055 [Carex littledalei]